VVIGVTFVAYTLNIYALRALSASTVSAYIYLQPVFTTVIAFIISGVTPHALHGIAAALIFTGVYLVSKKNAES
jgi:drug/metabolite transporter (DMT)-like permease